MMATICARSNNKWIPFSIEKKVMSTIGFFRTPDIVGWPENILYITLLIKSKMAAV